MCKILSAGEVDISIVKQIEIRSGLSPWSEADYLIELNRDDSLFFVAKNEQQETVGFVLARLIMNLDTSLSNEIEIYNIAIDKDYRRKSGASALLDRIIQIGFDKGVQRIFLEVRKSNMGAQSFYKNYSFSVCGERKNFYTNPTDDAILMCRDLKSI